MVLCSVGIMVKCKACLFNTKPKCLASYYIINLVKNDSMNKKNNIIALAIFSFFFLSVGLIAQSSVGGNLMIAENGSMSIYSNHNFAKGSGFITPGMVHTSRTGAKGYLLFEEGSSWTGATNGRFVDGNVKVMHDQPFIFPVGQNNLYRPVSITGAAFTTASYFAKSPKKPLAKINTNGLKRTSEKEYWEVSGEATTQLSFLWGRESNIANITSGQLDQLTIVGWKNGQWRIIPSTVAKHIPVGITASSKVESNFDEGVIATKEAIVPNDFEYFTLASLEQSKTLAPSLSPSLVSVFPNPVVKELFVNIEKFKGKIGSIKIYNIDGKEMASRELGDNAATTQQFDASNYENGMYKMYIKVDNQTHTTKFMVGRMY